MRPRDPRPSWLARATGFAHRLALATDSLGALNAFRVLVAARFTRKLRRIRLPGVGRDFHYRGWDDAGVLSHFYLPGYRIADTPDRPIRRIVDAGANIGDETLRFWAHHPGAEIVAVEPEAGNFSVLRRNFGDEPRVHLVRAGLWSSVRPLRLLPGSRSEGFRVAEAGDDRSPDVDATTIPSLMERLGWDAIDVLKLDIEGAEYELFESGASDWLPRVGAMIFECPDNDRPGTTMAIFAAAAGMDFNVYVCGENLVMLRRSLPWRLRVESKLRRFADA